MKNFGFRNLIFISCLSTNRTKPIPGSEAQFSTEFAGHLSSGHTTLRETEKKDHSTQGAFKPKN